MTNTTRPELHLRSGECPDMRRGKAICQQIQSDFSAESAIVSSLAKGWCPVFFGRGSLGAEVATTLEGNR